MNIEVVVVATTYIIDATVPEAYIVFGRAFLIPPSRFFISISYQVLIIAMPSLASHYAYFYWKTTIFVLEGEERLINLVTG